MGPPQGDLVMEQVVLTEKQKEVLGLILKSDKADAAEFDKRSIKALEMRELVKLTETKKGTFVKATAKGKKALN
jgi:predicted MarR family transcription regulator